MKIKALSRASSSIQAPGSDTAKTPRNLDPALHPFERAREYSRALNATKMERMFAQPFVAQLGKGHVDGVYKLAKDPNNLSRFASGSGDGVIKVWDLGSREQTWTTSAHETIIKGMSWTGDKSLLSCASDKTVKLWTPYSQNSNTGPVKTWLGTGAFSSLSAHGSNSKVFAAAMNDQIQIYDIEKGSDKPMEAIKWPSNSDTVTQVAFNQVETSILASTSTDRSIILYDLRTSMPLAKTVLRLASNAISWNPMEAMNFAVANEDHNVYIFDMRKMDRALNVLKDHVAAVMDVEFSPTGEELVTASYDRTIRLWRRGEGHSRDIYHTKRMQRVFSCRWSPDNKFILSGSDDGNIRLWRSKASDRGGIKSAKQRTAEEYNAALSARYAHMPEIKRIQKHRHVPKVIKKAGEIKSVELSSIKRREENERKHSKKQFDKRKSEREKMILTREK